MQMGERQQPTNSGLLATHLARRRPDAALGEAPKGLGWEEILTISLLSY
jgi:hypothetical protein